MLKNINEHLINEISLLLGDDDKHFMVNQSNILECTIESRNLIQILRFLRDDDKLVFHQLIDLFGVDRPAKTKRFEVKYSLLSTKFNYRVNINIQLSDDEEVPSIHKLFPNAIWYQREVFDMYGVNFSETTDGRRILTDYGFEGHPLRKDFPLTGYKEVRYDVEQKKVVYEPVKLVQDYREFDFVSPWEGTDYKLPGDEKAEEE